MLPITAYPEIISRYGKYFNKSFSSENLSHFKNYLTGLIIGQNKTVSGINDQLVFAGDQSSLNRFLTDTTWDSESINNQRIELLKQTHYTKPKKSGVISIDDTLVKKSGKKMEGADWFYDHNEGKSVYGHNFVSSYYWDKDTAYPLYFEMYRKEGGIPKEQFKTKIKMAMDQIDKCEQAGIPAEVYTFDSWFCTKDLTEHIDSYGKAWVSQVKSNRLVLYNGERIKLSEFVRDHTKPKDYQAVKINKKDLCSDPTKFDAKGGDQVTYYCYTKSVTLKSLGRVRIVVSFDNKKLEGKPVILGTNKLNWSQPKKVITTYGHRWPIETFYRDSKQSLGFSDYRLRDTEAVKKHICLVFLAYSLLEISRRESSSIVYRVGSRLNTIGQTARESCREVFKELIFWVHQKFKQDYDPDYIYQLLVNWLYP